MRLFGEALKIDPKNVSALLSRASINIALGKYQAADEDIDPILKASPNHFMANYLRGVELARRKKYAEADRILDRISTGFAAFWPGYFVQGATKLELGQYAQAETTFGKYLAHVPDDIKAAPADRLRACAEFRADPVALSHRAQKREILHRSPRGVTGSH